jgi:glucokinase
MQEAGPLHAGFDLGGTELKFGLVDPSGRVIHSSTAPTPKSFSGLMETLGKIWRDLTRDEDTIGSAGFGFPGIFSASRSVIVRSPHCRWLEGIDLNGALSGLLNVPFILDNEANLAAFGEHAAGAGREAHSLVLITIGSGIGTGLVLDGHIWRGVSGFAGELGHAPVNPSGTLCRCGLRGCLESEVSASRIVEEYRRLGGDPGISSADEVCRLAGEGDGAAREAFAVAGRALGIGIAFVINLLNPQVVLLGGGVMEAGSLLLDPTRAAAQEHSIPAAFQDCKIRPAALGNSAGFVGAALYSAHRINHTF